MFLQKPKCSLVIVRMLIHGPSLAIGAAIASIALIISFLFLGGAMKETELVIEPAPKSPWKSKCPCFVSRVWRLSMSFL